MAFQHDDQKEQVQQATHIVDLVGESLALRPRGKEFVGLCPFHDDSKPSMYVSPQKQIFKCFACGAGGDVFTWMTRYHKMTFPEALKYLAERAGITLKRGRGAAAGDQGSDRERIRRANEQALKFFRHHFKDESGGRIARGYVRDRGINQEMIEAFSIGYAPDAWDALANTVRDRGWDAKGFELAGLIATRDRGGGHYDRLRHRLIFPILDGLGRPIAFGGRVLEGSTRNDKSDAKYLNSHEHALFNKSATLYGLHLAKQPIIDQSTAIIVEGYTDVIACHQAGIGHVVATLGTALTPAHARELRKYEVERVVLIFDADEAGMKAADRALEVFLTEKLDVEVAVLPDALDPADLLAAPDGRARWDAALNDATDALAYQFQRMRQQFDAADTMTGRERLIEAYLRRLAELGIAQAGSLRRGMIIQRLAELLPIGATAIDGMLDRLESARRQQASRAASGTPFDTPQTTGPDDTGFPLVALAKEDAPHRVRVAERHLVGGLMMQPDLFHHVLTDGRTLDEAIAPSDLFTASAQRLYQMIHDRLAEDHPVTLSNILAQVAETGDGALGDFATDAEAEVEHATGDNDETLRDVVLGAAEAIAAHHRDRTYRRTRDALNATRDHETTSETSEQDEARWLRAVQEHLAANPSPTRLPRVSESPATGAGG